MRQHHKLAKTFGLARFQLKDSAGPLPQEKLMRSIELYARKMMAMVREMMGSAGVDAAGRRWLEAPAASAGISF